MSDPVPLADRLRALVEFIDLYPLPPALRERMSFREFNAVLQAKEVALGLDDIDWTQAEHIPALRIWAERIGYVLSARGLVAETHHLDLPVNFHAMPEYEPLLDAEDAFWDAQTPGTEVDDATLLELVKTHAPTLANGQST